MNPVKTSKILKALDLDFYLPRYSNVDVHPLIMKPKVLAVSSLVYEKKSEEKMLKAMLYVLDLPANCVSIAKRKNVMINDDDFLLEVQNIIEKILPKKVLYFGDEDENKSNSNWIFVPHPRHLVDEPSQKKAAYIKLLDLKKEL